MESVIYMYLKIHNGGPDGLKTPWSGEAAHFVKVYSQRRIFM